MTENTLFSYLAHRFVTQRENLATEALLFIIDKSEVAKDALVAAVTAAGSEVPAELSFRTQAAGADGAIPDLVGEDRAGHQVLIIDFYNSLQMDLEYSKLNLSQAITTN